MQLPVNVSGWCDTYMQLRPLLVGTDAAATTTFFVTYAGDKRSNISALCRTTVEKLVGITVNPHAFRTIVASALYEQGMLLVIIPRAVCWLITVACYPDMSHSDVQAVSTAMLTSESTLIRYYIKVHPQQQYRQAQDKLNKVLGKRARSDQDEESTDNLS